MTKGTSDEGRGFYGTGKMRDRRVYDRFHAYLKRSAALDGTSPDFMDRTKILLRLTMWKMEHPDMEGSQEELWADISEGYGQERMGELLAGMNGTLISYASDREDTIHVTDLGMKVVTDAIRDIHHNCPL